mmetsp:Transcript_44268/g.126749  ORF Transcript_44268/g.126749 Transcript_44268/m.126749 type:complete len:230 (+) Transcript_44268:1119-1808(+)
MTRAARSGCPALAQASSRRLSIMLLALPPRRRNAASAASTSPRAAKTRKMSTWSLVSRSAPAYFGSIAAARSAAKNTAGPPAAAALARASTTHWLSCTRRSRARAPLRSTTVTVGLARHGYPAGTSATRATELQAAPRLSERSMSTRAPPPGRATWRVRAAPKRCESDWTSYDHHTPSAVVEVLAFTDPSTDLLPVDSMAALSSSSPSDVYISAQEIVRRVAGTLGQHC